MSLLPGWIETLLRAERNSVHFEDFCLALLAAEGKKLWPTSRTYDLGRDGRRASKEAIGAMDVLAASLDKNVATKAAGDGARLADTTTVNELYFCSNQDLTEYAFKEVEDVLRAALPKAAVIEVLGATQIIDLALHHQQVVETHYAAELDSIRRALVISPSHEEGVEERALRLALMTQTGDDALALRQSLAQRLILELITDTGSKSISAIAASLSQQLRLPNTISDLYITGIVRTLVGDGLAVDSNGVISVTEAGKELAETVPVEGAAQVLEGREVVREAIKRLSGHSLQTDAFNRFWRRFQDSLASSFYLQASTMVSMVAAITSGTPSSELPEARVLREKIARDSTIDFTSRNQREEVSQAVIDMFSEKDSRAFEWLSTVCSVFVMLCSLGLEVKSAAETSKTLRRITLVTDTDILLSLVCEREPNHDEITRIIELWQGLRGRVAAPVPALEETAYHASIATTEYQATADLLTRIDDVQADHLLNNAFVRSFRQLAESRTSRRFWESYIRQFRGQHEYDYSVLLRYLQEQFRVGPFEISRASVEDEKRSLYSRMQTYMIRQRAAEVGKESDELDSRIVDKCRRDALLLTMVQHARAGMSERGSGETVIAISSSTLLKRMDAAFRNELGEPEAVISLSAVAVLLSLVPGVSMTMGTLKGVLFDLRLAKRLNPLQQYVYRLIARSDEYTLAWSKRVTLQRQLNTELLRDARSGVKRTVDVERAVLRSDNPEHSAEVVKRALDRMAIDSASETRIIEQQREIERLRALVEKLGGRSQ